MNLILLTILVALSGGCSVLVRFLANFWATEFNGIVLSTFVINNLGSFLIGVFYKLFSFRVIEHETYIILCAGFLGGLTTFSGYTLNLALLCKENITFLLLYGFLMSWLGMCFTLLGFYIVDISVKDPP